MDVCEFSPFFLTTYEKEDKKIFPEYHETGVFKREMGAKRSHKKNLVKNNNKKNRVKDSYSRASESKSFHQSQCVE